MNIRRFFEQAATSLALTGFWPLLMLGEGRAGVSTSGICVLAAAISQFPPKQRFVNFPPLVVAFALACYFFVVSLPLGDWAVARISIFLGISVPLYILVSSQTAINSTMLSVSGLALVAVRELATLPSEVHTLAQGQALWVATVSSFFVPVRLPLRLVFAGTTGIALVQTPTSGPVIALIVAMGVVAYRELRGRLPAKVLAIGGLAVAVPLIARDVLTEYRDTPELINNVATRYAVWEEVIRSSSLLGNGLREIQYNAGARATGNAHNVILDALWVGGVLGVVMAGSLLYVAVRRSSQMNVHSHAVVWGLATALLFSGAVLEGLQFWVVLGLGLRRDLDSLPAADAIGFGSSGLDAPTSSRGFELDANEMGSGRFAN